MSYNPTRIEAECRARPADADHGADWSDDDDTHCEDWWDGYDCCWCSAVTTPDQLRKAGII